MITLARIVGLVGFLSLVGLLVSFVRMEFNRTGKREARFSLNPLGSYAPQFFSQQGLVARDWCDRFLIAFVTCFLIIVGLAIVHNS